MIQQIHHQQQFELLKKYGGTTIKILVEHEFVIYSVT